MPDQKTKRRIFQIHTGRMTLADDVNIEEFVMAKVGVLCLVSSWAAGGWQGWEMWWRVLADAMNVEFEMAVDGLEDVLIWS